MGLISAHSDYVHASNRILAFTLNKCLFIALIILSTHGSNMECWWLYDDDGFKILVVETIYSNKPSPTSVDNICADQECSFSYLIIRKDAHQKFIDIIRLLTDLAEQYSLENYLTADYDILHECTDGLDNAICDLQEESGWLTAVRTLTSLSCTSAIACHIYKEWEWFLASRIGCFSAFEKLWVS